MVSRQTNKRLSIQDVLKYLGSSLVFRVQTKEFNQPSESILVNNFQRKRNLIKLVNSLTWQTCTFDRIITYLLNFSPGFHVIISIKLQILHRFRRFLWWSIFLIDTLEGGLVVARENFSSIMRLVTQLKLKVGEKSI